MHTTCLKEIHEQPAVMISIITRIEVEGNLKIDQDIINDVKDRPLRYCQA